jgi:hypothetical protein
MDGLFPDTVPDFPVLWASTTPLSRAKKAPFGECRSDLLGPRKLPDL